MTIVFEMMGGNVPEDRIQNLIKNLVVQEIQKFAAATFNKRM